MRERAKIVRRADPHQTFFDGFENARCKREFDAVTQLDAVEPEVHHLAHHLVAIVMAMRAPAGGKREFDVHARKQRKNLSCCTKKENRAPKNRRRGDKKSGAAR